MKVRILNVENGKLSLTMREWNEKSAQSAEEGEGEADAPRRGRGRGGGSRDSAGDDDDGSSRGRAPAKIDDIYSDNTEPKWKDISEAAASFKFENVLELTL